MYVTYPYLFVTLRLLVRYQNFVMSDRICLLMVGEETVGSRVVWFPRAIENPSKGDTQQKQRLRLTLAKFKIAISNSKCAKCNGIDLSKWQESLNKISI